VLGDEKDPHFVCAYQAGFHAALRDVAQALNVQAPKMKPDQIPTIVAAPKRRKRATRAARPQGRFGLRSVA